MDVKDFGKIARIACRPGPESPPVAGRRDPKTEGAPGNEKSRMGAASLRKAIFEGSRLAFGNLLTDLFRQPFTSAPWGKIPLYFRVPRRFFDPLKPADELPPFLFRQALDRFLDGLERHNVKLTYRLIAIHVGIAPPPPILAVKPVYTCGLTHRDILNPVAKTNELEKTE